MTEIMTAEEKYQALFKNYLENLRLHYHRPRLGIMLLDQLENLKANLPPKGNEVSNIFSFVPVSDKRYMTGIELFLEYCPQEPIIFDFDCGVIEPNFNFYLYDKERTFGMSLIIDPTLIKIGKKLTSDNFAHRFLSGVYSKISPFIELAFCVYRTAYEQHIELEERYLRVRKVFNQNRIDFKRPQDCQIALNIYKQDMLHQIELKERHND